MQQENLISLPNDTNNEGLIDLTVTPTKSQPTYSEDYARKRALMTTVASRG